MSQIILFLVLQIQFWKLQIPIDAKVDNGSINAKTTFFEKITNNVKTFF